MKKYLILYALAATVAAWAFGCRLHRANRACSRLETNQQALYARLERQEMLLNESEASIDVLRLRCREFEQLRAADAKKIRKMGIRLRELMSTSEQVSRTELQLSLPLQDSLPVIRHNDSLRSICDQIGPHSDTLRRFRWRDPWVTLEGEIRRDTITCRLHSIDTLHQIVRRIPRRFLFIRWGTKAIRQEIRSSNPHTRLVYSDYLLIEP